MKPSGAHTHPDGGPGLGLAVIVALVLIVAGSAGAAVHTAEHALDVLVHVLLVVLAVAAGMSRPGSVSACSSGAATRRARPRGTQLLSLQLLGPCRHDQRRIRLCPPR
jgi:hypothetical protein